VIRAGLELGADAVRVCVVEVGEGPRWLASAVEELPVGAIVDGEIRQSQAVVAAVERAMNELDADFVTVGYRGDAAVSTSLSLPLMSERELAEQIRWEAEQHVPFDTSTCALEYRIAGVSHERGLMTVRLTAIQNALVEALVALTKQAGLELRAVELLEDALLRVHRLGPPRTEPSAMVAALADVDLTAVVKDGELVEARVGDVRQVLDFVEAAHDVKASAAMLLGPRAKAVAEGLHDGLQASVWKPGQPGLKPVSAEFGVALGLALPGSAMTRVGAKKRRGLWSRLFG